MRRTPRADAPWLTRARASGEFTGEPARVSGWSRRTPRADATWLTNAFRIPHSEFVKMFTGLVETLGIVSRAEVVGAGRVLVVRADWVSELAIGESVAVNGACLTVVAVHDGECTFEVGPETLLKTNLGELVAGSRVNLERSLRVGDRLGGHFVQGHVDAVGTIDVRQRNGDWEDVWFRCPAWLTTLMVPKGSIAVDGVSLTLVNVEAERFSVMLIPHTQAITTLGLKQAGAAVNLEADMLAKHVAKLLGREPN